MKKIFQVWLYLTMIMLVAYTVVFIKSYIVNVGQLSYPLFDDGMITLEYAKNLARHGSISVGQNAVWTAGFTSWAWMLVLSLFALLPVSEYHLPFLVPLVNIVLLFLSLMLTSRISPRADGKASPIYWLLAVTTPSVLFWTLRGMEVPLAMLAVAVMTYLTYDLVSRKEAGSFSISSYLLISFLIPFIRPELSTLVFILALYGFLFTKGRTRYVFMLSCVAFGLGFLAYIKVNTLLFSQPFSNSYYLKMSGVTPWDRLTRGFTSTFVQMTHDWVYVLLAGLCDLIYMMMLAIRKDAEQKAEETNFVKTERQKHAIGLILVVTAALVAIWVMVGGDAWEELPLLGRFLVPCVPLVYALLDAYADSKKPVAGYLQVLAAAFVVLNIGYSISVIGLSASNDKKYSIIGYELGREFGPGVTSMHYWYGQPSYYASINGGKSIDALGKIDPVVARTTPKLHFKPGHDRWNHEHSIGELHPDIIVNMPCPAPHDLSYDCSKVWDEITVKYGYTPHTGPGGIVTLFVSPQRPELERPVENFVLGLHKKIKVQKHIISPSTGAGQRSQVQPDNKGVQPPAASRAVPDRSCPN
jgi:hypothetical protein